ncbi:hypothetical protein DFP72DRAFT_1074563 [Ephemerocybe angulata]|uniref:Uncharacterized protein n=1 Tax=Ephemerocybe angulata TaxID=980116 RepID=A0A8H6M1C8_9AGAR|nr:hypothetical protein DFP72DRAFT_1074563 [Tulosesus angulatus]
MKFAIVSIFLTFLMALALVGARPISFDDSEYSLLERDFDDAELLTFRSGELDLELDERSIGKLLSMAGKGIVKGFQAIHKKVQAARAARKAKNAAKKAAQAQNGNQDQPRARRGGRRKRDMSEFEDREEY